MATAIGTRAAKHGHTIECMSRNTAKAQALADQIGNRATVGTFGATPAGDIVVVAVLYTGAVEVVANYGDALAGKILKTSPWSCSSPATAPRRKHASRRFWRAWTRGPSTQEGSRWPRSLNGPASSW
jgi:predicted dinucleotide-binding enzyme